MIILIILGYVIIAGICTAIFSSISDVIGYDDDIDFETILLTAAFWPLSIPLAIIVGIFLLSAKGSMCLINLIKNGLTKKKDS